MPTQSVIWSYFDDRDEYACLMCDFMSKSLKHMWWSMFARHDYFAASVWYDGVYDGACLDVWLGFVMWQMPWCHD